MTGRLARYARGYAERLGWRVFPITPGAKQPPLIRAWQDAATCDPETVSAWWQQWPNANIAVACGVDSGIFTLDVDDESGVVEIEQKHGALPELFPQVWTARAWQAVFAYPEGRTIRNSAGRLAAGLDTRGEGGYFIAPPSMHPTGVTYQWADDRTPLDIPPERMPAWLLDLLDPPKPAEPARGQWHGPSGAGGAGGGENRRVLKAFRAELALVAAAANGRRNDQLNESAYALLRFVKSGDLPASLVRDALADAAAHAGLGPIETLQTIRSAASARGVDVG